jgi:hypothetical protein
MNTADNIKEFSKLLNTLDGVNVVDVTQTTTRIGFLFTVESHRSHHWLEYCAEAANVPLNCRCRYNPGSDEALENPALGVIYQYEIKMLKTDSEEFESIRYLGAHLVWLMHYMGKLEKDEANRLLGLWGALNVEERRPITQMSMKGRPT